jgi:hypothetical protein
VVLPGIACAQLRLLSVGNGRAHAQSSCAVAGQHRMQHARGATQRQWLPLCRTLPAVSAALTTLCRSWVYGDSAWGAPQAGASQTTCSSSKQQATGTNTHLSPLHTPLRCQPLTGA